MHPTRWLAIVALVTVLVVLGSTDIAATQAAQQSNIERPSNPIDPDEVIGPAYSENALNAFLNYEGKVFTVRGFVTSITGVQGKKDHALHGSVYFISNSSKRRVFGDKVPTAVIATTGTNGNTIWHCDFDPDHTMPLTSLRPGDEVILKGRLVGYMNFSSCQLLEKTAEAAIEPPKPNSDFDPRYDYKPETLVRAERVKAAEQSAKTDIGKGGVTAPKPLYTPDPDYTAQALKSHLQGKVTLSCLVGADGRLHDIRVVKGIGKGLDEQAVATLQKWTFQPATKDGQQVAVQINVEVQFKMH